MALPLGPLINLDLNEFSVIAASVSHMTGVEAEPVRVAHGVDAALSWMNEESRAQFRALLSLIENYGAGRVSDPRPFTEMTEDSQIEWLDTLRRSSSQTLRTAYSWVRSLCASTFYSSPESWPILAYPGPPALESDDVLDDSKAGLAT